MLEVPASQGPHRTLDVHIVEKQSWADLTFPVPCRHAPLKPLRFMFQRAASMF